MNQKSLVTPLNRYLTLGISLVLLIMLLQWFLEDILREVVIIPFLYLFWVGQFFYAAIPQHEFWVIFCLIATIIMGRSLWLRRERPPKNRVPERVQPPRIQRWLTAIERSGQDDYFKLRLAQEIQQLTLEKIAYQHGQTIKETRRQLRQGQLMVDVPPDIQAYLQSSLVTLSRLSGLKRLMVWHKPTTPLDVELERVVQFLETMDEVSYVKAFVLPALVHRLILDPGLWMKPHAAEEIVSMIRDSTPVPVLE
ncbi:hypothetical protein QUF58_11770 [Anaerolineales bacterium HSG24]|nr:hypothetical protein [Anaerolineales bacterium HSG24]